MLFFDKQFGRMHRRTNLNFPTKKLRVSIKERILEAKTDCSAKDRHITFCGERAWHPPDNATPSNFLFTKILEIKIQDLSADVSFVSVLAMVLSEY